MSAQPKSMSFGYIGQVIRYPGKGKRHFFIVELIDGEHKGEKPICNLSCDWVFDLPIGSYIYVKRDVRIEPGQMFVDMISLAAQTPDVKQMALELGIEIPSLSGWDVLEGIGVKSADEIHVPTPVEELKASSVPGPTGGSHTFDAYKRDYVQRRIEQLGICPPNDPRRGGKYIKHLVDRDLAAFI
jgi:hypothetical protein